MILKVVAVNPESYDELNNSKSGHKFDLSIITETGVVDFQEYEVISWEEVEEGKILIKIQNIKTGERLYVEREEE